MVCPYCGDSKVWYSEIQTLHLVRSVTGSRKRYCRRCKRKWKLRVRRQSLLVRDALVVLAVCGIGLVILYVFQITPFNRTVRGGDKTGGPGYAGQNGGPLSLYRHDDAGGASLFGTSRKSAGQLLKSGTVRRSTGLAGITGAVAPGAENQILSLARQKFGDDPRIMEAIRIRGTNVTPDMYQKAMGYLKKRGTGALTKDEKQKLKSMGY